MDKVTFHDLVQSLKNLAKELGRTPTLLEFANIHSRRQIDKFKYSKIVSAAGLEPNKYSQSTDPVEVVIRPPKILVFDLEVSTKIVHTYQMYDVNHSPDHVIQDFYILSFAAKWIGSDEVIYMDIRNARPKNNDLSLLKKLHALIDEADFVVGHNMGRFDLPTIKSRFIMNDLPPVRDVPVIDTLRIARKHFKFTSNKLSELAKYLKCKNEKDSHSEFPGISLFTEAMKGNKRAFESMEHYCKMDVVVTEQIFHKLAPWEKTINFQSFYQEAVCSCGNKQFYKNGLKYQRSGIFQIWRCSVCQKTFIDKHNHLNKDIKKGLLS
jgi:uncharacterized protein YprB with RNaseH-like and TPR domain